MKMVKRRVNGVLIEHLIDDAPQPIPLGDRIAAVAQPVARAIDKVFGTKIENCGGCGKTKARLNAGMSIANAVKLRLKGE